jgi:hypothetical protein
VILLQLARSAGSRTEISRTVDTEEDTDTVKTWKAAVNNIKSVMDTVNPIVKVCPISFFFPLQFAEPISSPLEHASLALSLLSNIHKVRVLSLPRWIIWNIHTFLSPCRQTLGGQFQRDENSRNLLEAIRETVEFANEADILRRIQPGSAQAKSLMRCCSASPTVPKLSNRVHLWVVSVRRADISRFSY